MNESQRNEIYLGTNKSIQFTFKNILLLNWSNIKVFTIKDTRL